MIGFKRKPEYVVPEGYKLTPHRASCHGAIGELQCDVSEHLMPVSSLRETLHYIAADAARSAYLETAEDLSLALTRTANAILAAMRDDAK